MPPVPEVKLSEEQLRKVLSDEEVDALNGTTAGCKCSTLWQYCEEYHLNNKDTTTKDLKRKALKENFAVIRAAKLDRPKQAEQHATEPEVQQQQQQPEHQPAPPRACPARDLPASVVVNAPSESIDRHARTACAHVIARKSQWLEVFTGFDNALIVEWFTTYLTENIVYTIKRSNGITATSSDPEVLDSLSDGDVVAQHVNLALAAQSFLEAHSDPSSRWDNNSLARVVVCKFHDGAKFRASTFGIDPGRHNLDDPARRLNARTLNEDTHKLFNGYTPAGGFPWLKDDLDQAREDHRVAALCPEDAYNYRSSATLQGKWRDMLNDYDEFQRLITQSGEGNEEQCPSTFTTCTPWQKSTKSLKLYVRWHPRARRVNWDNQPAPRRREWESLTGSRRAPRSRSGRRSRWFRHSRTMATKFRAQ